ncbi:MAG: hypothetical protein LIO49_08105 [Ruminococcus sp.]|nr:hypothetical protein [Ruminococcus sp.]
MTRKRIVAIIVAVVLAAICLSVVRVWFTPKARAAIFVAMYGDYIEEQYAKGIAVVDGVLCRQATFYGRTYRYQMIEYDFYAFGDTYYGCYYSPDDKPMSYAQTNYHLVKQSEGYWTWEEKGGDNHGEVAKIRDGWYYYSVSF